jgi:hypothetical protein
MTVSVFLLVTLLAAPAAASAGSSFGESNQYFAQLAVGGGSTTSFSVHNPTDELVTIRFELFRPDGSDIIVQQIDVSPYGSQTLQFGDPNRDLTVGWAHLSSPNGRFEATEFFQIRVGDIALPRVGVLPSPPVFEGRIFGFVAGTTRTGVAVANPSSGETAQVTARAFDENGLLVATTVFEVEPRNQIARFLGEDPLFDGLNSFQGTVQLESSAPVVSVSLRSDDDLLTAVAVVTPQSGQLVPGSVTGELLADGAVTNSKLGPQSVTGDKIAQGHVVRSLNGLRDNVVLQAGTNTSVSSSGNTITISSTGGGGGGTITGVLAGSGLAGGGLSGNVSLSIPNSGVTSGMISPNAIGSRELANQFVLGQPGQPGLLGVGSGGPDPAAFLFSTPLGAGGLGVLSSDGRPRAAIGAMDTIFGAAGALGIFNLAGTVPIVSVVPNVGGGGGVFLKNAWGYEAGGFSTTAKGAGAIETLNEYGNQVVLISPTLDGGGAIGVKNSFGVDTAGIQGSTGLVFGLLKSFRVPDPTDPSRLIQYSAIEGPEAAIYVRGTGQLVNGRALVEMPEHFAAMASSESMTVSVTPRSSHSRGLAVVDVSPMAIEVAELSFGSGTYDFDYTVFAVRAGFEDYEVYGDPEEQEASELSPVIPAASGTNSMDLLQLLEAARDVQPKSN